MYKTSIGNPIFSNHKDHGGNFENEFNRHIKTCDSLEIATGYFGVSTLHKYRSALVDVASRGSCKILIGMIFNEGVSASQKNTLEKLHNDLIKANPKSGVYITLKNYHGKVYKFNNANNDFIYVGSSNFSDSGFKTNYEFNTLVNHADTKKHVNNFLQFLFDKKCDFVKPLDLVELVTKGNKLNAEKNEFNKLRLLRINANDFPTNAPIATLKIKLRPDSQPNSSLNLCFEAGRLSKGKYIPRPWYEVEITCTKGEISQLGYPKGDFNAFVQDDGAYYRIPMVTASDGYKAMTSKNNRHILGVLIKDRLERSGALKRGERITSETLADYGNDEITLKKISNKNYILEF